MANATLGSRATCDVEPFPSWVIHYIIALSAYAESRNFPIFESKISQATEALLIELNAKAHFVKESPSSNVVPFCPSESSEMEIKAAI
ncbi:hypothetical protein E4L95_23210 [Paracoccus liaowanqingii]|uniref:Uncharacterized protein n=1 Tax=Paracoccus liaowanqingii TaxID=2560053 RepID=A0A4Z1C595_9RHOB|nr:hypothetical protein [Paracoccus liaowanqingii]TGN36201.1 hypothetical protein E4L95_23210 [Paracoccus liaowanqingii]